MGRRKGKNIHGFLICRMESARALSLLRQVAILRARKHPQFLVMLNTDADLSKNALKIQCPFPAFSFLLCSLFLSDSCYTIRTNTFVYVYSYLTGKIPYMIENMIYCFMRMCEFLYIIPNVFLVLILSCIFSPLFFILVLDK